MSRALNKVSTAARRSAEAASQRDITIRAAHTAGETIRAIGIAAGLTHSRIHQIVHAEAK